MAQGRTDLLWGVLPVLLAGAGYYATLAPDVGLGDTAILLDQMIGGKLASHVNTHNLTVALGWLYQQVPLGTAPVKGHLVSWTFATLGVALCTGVLRQWGLRPATAALSTGVLAVSHSYWWHATLVESYAANAALLLGMLALLERHRVTAGAPWLFAASVVAGFGLFNHVQLGTLGLACLAWAVAPGVPGARLRNLATVVGGGLVGLAPWLGLLAWDLTRRDQGEVLRWAAGGDFQGIMFTAVGSPVADLGRLMVHQFPSPFLLLVPIGLWAVVRDRDRRPAALACGVVWLVNTGFFLYYRTWDQFAFYLPTWVVTALVAALGARELARHWPTAVHGALALCIAIPVVLYPAVPDAVRSDPDGFWGERYTSRFTRNSHDVAAYLASPDKSDWDDVRVFADAVFDGLPQGATLFDDDSRTYYPLDFYQRHEGARPDLNLVLMNSWGFDGWGATEQRILGMIRAGRRPTFVVTDHPPFATALAPLFAEGYRLVPFDLAHGRWVYAIARPDADHPETPIGAVTVRPRAKKQDTVRPGAWVFTKVAMPEGRTPRWLRWRWLRPDGSEADAPDARLIPSAALKAVTFLQVPDDGPAGTWTAVLVVDGSERSRHPVVVDPGPDGK